MLALREQVLRIWNLLRSTSGFDPASLQPIVEVLRRSEAQAMGGRIAGSITRRLAARALQQLLKQPTPTPTLTSWSDLIQQQYPTKLHSFLCYNLQGRSHRYLQGLWIILFKCTITCIGQKFYESHPNDIVIFYYPDLVYNRRSGLCLAQLWNSFWTSRTEINFKTEETRNRTYASAFKLI